jgi:dihydrofolate reductase
MTIIIIAAMAQNRVIGKGNDIPWRIEGEQALFKKITMGHTVVMGRKTFESIGRPLPGRKNVVISRQSNYRPQGCLVAESFDASLAICRDDEKIFIAGGGQVYKIALQFADEIRLTVIGREIPGDVFFPEFSDKDFHEISTERVAEPEPYIIKIYRRKR